ncbi:hypothetical protein CEXT_747571 [Caerostris extrusa]|uniref:Ribosomal protein L34 n=1 Tax=Caerostris extrusa TaxID=172846 RepID=A0AAV4T4Z5_CAEEX|nr:hypothetical protein CEXT_747571 [Caerostris extrusa]
MLDSSFYPVYPYSHSSKTAPPTKFPEGIPTFNVFSRKIPDWFRKKKRSEGKRRARRRFSRLHRVGSAKSLRGRKTAH